MGDQFDFLDNLEPDSDLVELREVIRANRDALKKELGIVTTDGLPGRKIENLTDYLAQMGSEYAVKVGGHWFVVDPVGFLKKLKQLVPRYNPWPQTKEGRPVTKLVSFCFKATPGFYRWRDIWKHLKAELKNKAKMSSIKNHMTRGTAPGCCVKLGRTWCLFVADPPGVDDGLRWLCENEPVPILLYRKKIAAHAERIKGHALSDLFLA